MIKENRKLLIILAPCTVVIFFVLFYLCSDSKVINEMTIKENLIPVEKLITNEYSFTDVLEFSDSNEWIVLNSLTKNKYIATIEGKVYTETNLENLECIPKIHKNKLKEITFKVPHSNVSDVYIDHSSLKVLEKRNGLHNPVQPEDTNEILIDLENNKVEHLKEIGVLEKADEETKNILERHVYESYGDEVNVNIEFF